MSNMVTINLHEITVSLSDLLNYYNKETDLIFNYRFNLGVISDSIERNRATNSATIKIVYSTNDTKIVNEAIAEFEYEFKKMCRKVVITHG